MEKEKMTPKVVMDVAAIAALFIPFLIVTGTSLAVTGIHSLWIYSFGSAEKKERRRADMADYRKNMYNFD